VCSAGRMGAWPGSVLELATPERAGAIYLCGINDGDPAYPGDQIDGLTDLTRE
jgi:hypothetical protein